MANNADAEQAVSDLEAVVANEPTVDGSAKTLISRLNQMVIDALAAGGTPQAIVDRVRALTVAVKASQDDLSAAVLAGTPAAP